MSASAHYLDALARFADFDGRASRAELFGFLAVHVGITLLLLAASVAVGQIVGLPWIASGAVLSLYLVLVFFPLLSLVARRLHDTGRSSFWVALGVIPVAGLIVLYWLFLPGDPEPNTWGQPPDA